MTKVKARGGRRKGKGLLVLASTGLTPGHMTLETLTSLRECDRVFSCVADVRTCATLRACGVAVRRFEGDLGQSRAFAAALAAARAAKKAAYLTYGDPLFRNRDALLLMEACRREGIPCQVHHGVSSLNLLLGGLLLSNLEPRGVYLCAPGDPHRLCPEVPTLVFSTAQTERHVRRRFVAAVQRLYPPDHRAELVVCLFQPEPGLRRTSCLVRDLGAAFQDADPHSRATLYLPRVPA